MEEFLKSIDMKTASKMSKYLFKETINDEEAKELGYLYHKLLKDMLKQASTVNLADFANKTKGEQNEELNKNTDTFSCDEQRVE